MFSVTVHGLPYAWIELAMLPNLILLKKFILFSFFKEDFRRTACTSLLLYVLEKYGGDSEWERTREVYDVKSHGMSHTNTDIPTLGLKLIHTSSLLFRSEQAA